MSEIFPEQIEPAVLFTKNLANPVNVQSAETGARNDRRPYVRLDLIALANTIVTVQRHADEIAKELVNQRIAIKNLSDRVTAFETSQSNGKIARMLTALAQIEFDEGHECDPEDRY